MDEFEKTLQAVSQLSPGLCPNFLLVGNSFTVMERNAIRLAKTIAANKLISFKGAVKYFTIKMPYCENEAEVQEFVKRMTQSVAIARDCYDRYKGLVLIELDSGWKNQNDPAVLSCLADYIRTHREIRFIILASTLKGSLTREILCTSTWMKIEIPAPSPTDCLARFLSLARQRQYRVSREAKRALIDLVSAQSSSVHDSLLLTESLFHQIDFDLCLGGNNQHVICAKDIAAHQNLIKKEPDHHRIGFEL